MCCDVTINGWFTQKVHLAAENKFYQPRRETYTYTLAELNPWEQSFLPRGFNGAWHPKCGIAAPCRPHSSLQPFPAFPSFPSFPSICFIFSSIHLSPSLSSRVSVLSSDYFFPPFRLLPSCLLPSSHSSSFFSHPAFLLQAGGQGQGTTTLILCRNPYCFPCRPNCSEAWPGEL